MFTEAKCTYWPFTIMDEDAEKTNFTNLTEKKKCPKDICEQDIAEVKLINKSITYEWMFYLIINVIFSKKSFVVGGCLYNIGHKNKKFFGLEKEILLCSLKA